ncbi:MAG: hypothetical protein ACRDZ4_10970 [Egibacteraceae bacterium]
MANLTTTEDLRLDALFRAGEPASSSSQLYAKALEYVNRVQQDLLLGGAVAVGRDLATSAGIYAHVVDLPITDWWWARKQPRGIVTTDALIEAGTVTVTQGSAAATFSVAPAVSVAGWRLEVAKLPTVPRVLSHTAASTSATMDAPWPEATQTAAVYVVYNVEYDLASDFLRFAGAPYLYSRYQDPIPVSTREVHDQAYPFGTFFKEPPTAAALIQPRRIQLNSYDTRPYRLDYDYIFMPADLTASPGTEEPLLPRHHRAVLSIGSAMLLAFDKDDDRAKNLASEFRERVQRLVQEHRKQLSSGSMTYGVHRTRIGQSDRKGRIQPRGEQFLI